MNSMARSSSNSRKSTHQLEPKNELDTFDAFKDENIVHDLLNMIPDTENITTTGTTMSNEIIDETNLLTNWLLQEEQEQLEEQEQKQQEYYYSTPNQSLPMDKVQVRETQDTLLKLTCEGLSLEETPSSQCKRIIELPTKSKKRNTRWDQRRKEELVYLRSTVKELEEKLQKLHAAKSTEQQSIINLRANSNSTSSTTVVSKWEQIAQFQKAQAEKSQEENQKLKKMLEDQLQLAKNLETMLINQQILIPHNKMNQSNCIDQEESDGTNNRKKRSCQKQATTQEEIFQQLSKHLDTNYARTDYILKASNLLEIQFVVTERQVKLDENDDIYLEVIHANQIPFDWSKTSEAIWNVISQCYLQLSNGFYQVEACEDHTYRSYFTASMSLRGGDILLQTHSVGKQYREPDKNRHVLVWENTSTNEGTYKGVHDMELREKGWAIIERMENECTQIKTCTHILPIWSEDPDMQLKQQEHFGVITDLFLVSTTEKSKMLFQLIQNSLIQQEVNETILSIS